MAPAFAARPGALLALWALPALAIALVTALGGSPPTPGAALPSVVDTVSALGGLAARLYAELLIVIAFAAPAAALVRGAPLGQALGALRQRAVWVVAAALALWQTFALLLTLLPGLLALQANPLMSLIFLSVGTIGGAAAAIAIFARWMFAPAFAAEGLDATHALDASRAQAKAQPNLGFALGLALLLGLVTFGAGAVGNTLQGLAPAGRGALAATVLGSWAVLCPGLAVVTSEIAARHIGHVTAAPRASTTPTLALRARPSRCPRCGAMASVPTGEAAPSVTCQGCGLRAVLR